jgi:hypothetical protein
MLLSVVNRRPDHTTIDHDVTNDDGAEYELWAGLAGIKWPVFRRCGTAGAEARF